MSVFTAKFLRLENTEKGTRAIFWSKSKEKEWEAAIEKGLDLSGLQANSYYTVAVENFILKSIKEPEHKKSGGNGGYGKPYDPLQFVSNCVGSAIQAGAIKGPEDIDAWARQAWAAVTTLDKPQPELPAKVDTDSVELGNWESYPAGPWTCPDCGEQQIRKSKYKAEWYCLACKKKHHKDDPLITTQFYEGETSPPPKDMDDEEIPF